MRGDSLPLQNQASLSLKAQKQVPATHASVGPRPLRLPLVALLLQLRTLRLPLDKLKLALPLKKPQRCRPQQEAWLELEVQCHSPAEMGEAPSSAQVQSLGVKEAVP